MASELTPPPDLVGQVTGGLVWGGLMFVASIIGLWRYLGGKQNAEKIPPQEELTIRSVELINSSAVSDKIISYLTPKLDELAHVVADLKVAGGERDRKIEDILERLRKEENREEVARLAREEVARQLADERGRDRNREQSYPR